MLGNSLIKFYKDNFRSKKWLDTLSDKNKDKYKRKIDVFNKKSLQEDFSFDKWKNFDKLPKEAQEYFRTVEKGKATQEGLNQAMSKTMKVTTASGEAFVSSGNKLKDFGKKAKSSFSTFGKIAGNAIKGFGKGLLGIGANILINGAIGFGLDFLIGKIDDVVHAQEKLVESGKEASSTIKANQDAIASASQWKTGNLDRFVELAKGVDKTGHNLSLTTNEFSEYQSLASNLASTLPDLVVGFNELGQPILKASSSIKQLNQAFRDNEVKKYKENIKESEKVLKAFQAQYDNSAEHAIEKTGQKQKQAAYKAIIDKYYEDKAKKEKGEEVDGVNLGTIEYDGFNNVDARQALDELGIKVTTDDIEKNINSIVAAYEEGQQKVEEFASSVKAVLPDYLNISDDYVDLVSKNSNIGDLMQSIISNFDAETIQEFLRTPEQIKSWSKNVTEGLENSKVQNAINQLFTIDEKKSTMSFKDYEKQVTSLAKTIGDNVEGISKNQVLKSFDLDGTFTDISAAYEKISEKFGKDIANSLSVQDLELAGDIITDEDIDNAQEFTQALKDAKIDANAKDSFDSFSSAISKATTDLETLKTAMNESVSGSGLSSDTLNVFREMYGDDAEKALEKTANGYHINQKALSELQAQQKEALKTDYLSALNNQYSQLRKINEDIAKTAIVGGDVSGLLNQKSAIESQIQSLQDLQYQYDVANSAYQRWINAQSGANERDMYENIQSGYEGIKDLIERGWVDDDVRSYVDLLSSADLSTANAEEVIAAYNELGKTIGNSGHSIMDFFTVDENGKSTTDGIYNFFDTVKSVLGEEYASFEDGKYKFDFGNGKDKNVADALGMDVEAVQSILRAASEAGFEINLDQPISSLEELKTSAETAKETLKGLNDTSLSDINLDSNSLEEVDSQIQKVQEHISSLDPSVQTNQLEAANDILEYLVQKKEKLSKTTDIQFNLNNEEVLEKLSNANDKLKELGKTEVTFDFEADLEGITSQIKQAETLLNQFKNEDGVVDLSIEGAQEAVSIMQALLSRKEQLNQPAVMKVDTSQVSGDIGTAIGKIQEFKQALNDLSIAQEMKNAGVDIDTSSAQQKVQQLAGEIQGLDGDVKASLGLNTEDFNTALENIKNQSVDIKAGVSLDQSSISTINTSISAISSEIMVKAGVDPSAVDAYDPADKDAEVKYTVNSADVDSWTAPNKEATLTYNITTSGSLPGNKERTLTYKIKTEGSTGVNGTAHVNGTSGYANASGNWGIKKGGTSLVGELGTEILVRGSEFHTIGDNGAEFIQTKPGDIIFNHKQTEALLEHGYVAGRGKLIGGNAYVEGTAYSHGSGGLGRPSRPSYGMDNGSNSSNKGNKGNKTSNTANQISKNTKKTADTVKDISNELSNYEDWVERRFKAIESEFAHLEAVFERITHLPDKLAKAYELLAKNKEYMNTVNDSKSTYQSHLDKIKGQGLSQDIIDKIENGSLEISNYSEETQKLISEYETYYNKLRDCTAQYDELLSKQSELVQSTLDSVSDYYEMINNVDEASKAVFEAQRELYENLGISVTSKSQSDSLNKSIAEQEKITNRLTAQIEAYKAQIDTLVSSGYMQVNSKEYFAAHEALNQMNKELAESKSALIEFQDQLYELEYAGIQNIIDRFEQAVDKLDAKISYIKSKDEKVSESLYQEQINANNSQIREKMQLKAKKEKEQSLYEVGSTRYQELAEEINNLDKETYELLTSNEELKDSIFELRFADLEKGIQGYQDLRNEIEDFKSLLNEEAFFDKNGSITEDGLANLALLQQQMASAKQEIADYRTGLDKLQESFDNGVISETEYNEKSAEYREGIRNSIKDIKDYEDSLTDLYMTQMSKENEVIQKTIDQYAEARKRKASYFEYDKKLKGQQKSVDMLKAQIAALEGVNNATAAAEKKRLEAELKEEQESLDDIKREHKNEMMDLGDEKFKEDLDKILEDTEYEIIHNADKQQEVISNMLNNVVNMYANAYDKINSIIANTGFVGSSGFNSNQGQLGSQSGAVSQNNQATQHQSNVKPSGNASSTVTKPIENDNAYHGSLEQELDKKPNTDNRLVAELKLSTTSVTLEEGKSTKVTYSIRPGDAKNKALAWNTSNAFIASVSNGTIRAVSPGSCQVTVSTLDGSGISASITVTVTKKPEPPKPQEPQTPNNSGGDGKPNIGDAVIYKSGRYYYSSTGTSPAGNQMLGQTVYIGHINNASWAKKPYAIYRDKNFKQGLGWVSLDQLEGYKNGSKYIQKDGLAWTQEGSGGKSKPELIIRKSDGAMATMLHRGDAVAPNNLTENLFAWGAISPKKLLGDAVMSPMLPTMSNRPELSIVNNYDSLIRVEGNVDHNVVADLKQYEKEFLNKSRDYTMNYFNSELRKGGFRK